MPFDPTTAVLEKPRFDPSTVKLGASGFDPSTAVPAASSPYSELVAESQDFNRRAAQNTPENIGKQALITEDDIRQATPVPTGLGFNIPRTIAEPLVTNAPRVMLPLGTALATTGVGTLPGLAMIAGAGGLGELASQALEKETGQRSDYSLPQIATNTLLSGIPATRLTGIASPLVRAGIRVGEGALIGGSAPVIQSGLEGRLPELSDVERGALFGSVLGAPFGAIEASAGRLGPRVAPAPTPTLPGSTGIIPTELATVGRVMNESRLPPPTDIMPAELGAMQQIRSEVAAGEIARQAKGAETAKISSEADVNLRARALAERMMGKSAPDQLAILDQELRLQKDVITPAEERAGLEMKQLLKQQIDQQKALEQAAKNQQKAQADQQKAVADAQKQITEASKPPEIPESQQILAEPTAKPPVLANVATDIASHTEGSPFALQAKLNELTAAPPLAVETPPARVGRAPIETDPTKITADRAEYDRIAAEMKKEEPLSEKYNALWQKSEDVKNRHGGFVPEPVSPKQGEPTDALPKPSASEIPVRDQPQSGEGIRQSNTVDQTTAPARQAAPQENGPAPQGNVSGEVVSTELKPVNTLKRPELRAELTAAGITKTPKGVPIEDANAAQLMDAVGKLRRGQLERGAISPSALGPIAGAGSGAAYGLTQGDSPEERIRNAALYGSIGLAGGALGGALLNKAISKPIRTYQSPVLKDVAKMLTPIEEKSSLFEKLADAYGNFRYRFNTRFAPIGAAQRSLYKQVGKEFTPNRYYDLERGFERLSGAPVQAEGEVELLQNVIEKLPKQDVPHLDSYLTLSRIKDRLIKTSEENDRLMDAVGRAQAEYDIAVAKNTANPGVGNSASVVAKREQMNSALRKLNDEYNRKRVADWSIAKADTGLKDLQAEIGPEAFQRLAAAGDEYQQVMRRALQIQVDSGRMSQDLMKRVLDTNDFYAPFKVLKYYEDHEGFVKGGGMQRIPSSEQLVKKITGIDDTDVRIGSPTDVAAEQVYKGYILAQKNIKLRELATLSRLDPGGDFVRPMTEGMEPRKGYEAVTYFVNGEAKRMEVARPIANALTGLDASETDMILRSLRGFSSVFKMGATGLSVPFNIANAGVFDPLRLATISRYGFRGPQDFLYTLYEWPKALISSARGNVGQALGMAPDALYEQWIKSGAANSTLARVMTPEAFTGRLPKDMKVGEVLADTNGWLGKPIKVAALLSNTLEETTKLLGLQRAMRIERLDKLSPAQREQKWDEIVTEIRNYSGSPDFARAGVSMRPLNILLPFTNPRWQGFIADFARLNPFQHGNAKDAGAAWARLGSVVGLPAAGLAVYNLSTPENERDYLQIPKQERERYFHIPMQVGPDGKPTVLGTGKGYYFKNKDGVMIRGYLRIPKREFTGLMANTVEDFVQYARSNSPETFAQIAANFADNFAQTASPLNIQGDTLGDRALSAASGVNPALRLPLEVGLNRNLFTGKAIVPQGREKASPQLQYAENTPEGYKQAAGMLPDISPEALRSPAKLQHITEGLTGGFARQFASPKLSPANPAGEASPLLGRFYRSERVESEDLIKGANEAERARADQRITEQEVASKLADIIQAKPTPEAKQKALSDAMQAGLVNKETIGYLREELVDAQRGLTYEDRVIKRSYAIAGGFRAKYYLAKVQAMPAAEREAYLQDQHRKGLLTKDVVKQMAQPPTR